MVYVQGLCVTFKECKFYCTITSGQDLQSACHSLKHEEPLVMLSDVRAILKVNSNQFIIGIILNRAILVEPFYETNKISWTAALEDPEADPFMTRAIEGDRGFPGLGVVELEHVSLGKPLPPS